MDAAFGGDSSDNACSPAPPNPSRKDFVQENVLKDSLSDSWNESGGIGEEVRDGDLAFVVSAIDVCNDGYAKVAMRVTNTDDLMSLFYLLIPTQLLSVSMTLLHCLDPPLSPTVRVFVIPGKFFRGPISIGA